MISKPSFIQLAIRPRVVSTALKLSLLVGTVLAIINHGPAMLQFTLGSDNFLQIALTYLVPYCVSTYSAVKALQQTEASDDYNQPKKTTQQ
ncbi:hypothetical protein SIN8267_00962 [Sinobacterium norvegicum]|uniref:Phosphoenolpyruvate protein kinase n=1 Tax=Sinobacterium norvegicum TaxID=1641715 RepID=A0ABM9ACD8_9GAMM|nr:nitrate/nitrite transporter NrtS [Sinobacterium norvegicum]CAH0990862.1 hypothetical protein SIN8267_00962 [Sinobacterium norvegicum]